MLLCGGTTNFKIISNDIDSIHARTSYSDMHIDARKKVNFLAGLIYIIILIANLFQFYNLVNYDVKKFNMV